MLDQLFGSKTRVALLRLFIENTDQAYFVREMTRLIGAQINSVRRELINLVAMDILYVLQEPPEMDLPAWEEEPIKGLNKKKFYAMNKDFVLYNEIVALFSRSHLMVEKDMMDKLKNLDNVYLLIMTGAFSGLTEVTTDMLIVGNVKKDQLAFIVQNFEKKLGREINYTIMSLKEFEYRKDITDKFLYDILVGPKTIVIDKVGITDGEIVGA